jgi:hypothetical protein
MKHRVRRPRRRRADTTTILIRGLLFLAAATLLPALGMTIGTVGEEIDDRVTAASVADRYPVGEPTRCHVRALDDARSRLPGLDIEWRWAELDDRNAIGTALLDSRIVMIDPHIDCTDVPSVAYHEWTHIAQADYYGGGGLLDTTVTSDLVDDATGRPHEVSIHEVVADCAAMLLTDEHGDDPGPRPYMGMLGGCPADMLARAREVITQAGAELTDSAVSPLSEVGAAVAWVYRDDRKAARR